MNRFLRYMAFAVLFHVSAAHGEIFIGKASEQGPTVVGWGRVVPVRLGNPISKADAAALKSAIEALKSETVTITIILQSSGGDWDAAMLIGRLLRQTRSTAIVAPPGCSSACVLVLAGAVSRHVSGPVRIHRPYSTSVAEATYQDAQRRFRAMDTATRSYLSEMNIPERLYDAMLEIPSHSGRTLTEAELAQYRLDQKDVVEADVSEANAARRYGFSRQEYLRRKAQSEKECGPSTVSYTTNSTNSESDEEIRQRSLRYVECFEKIMK